MRVRILKDDLNKLVANVERLTHKRALVGIPGNAPKRKDQKEPPNHVLGFIHEFGEPALNIPPRPFLLPGVRLAHDRMVTELARGVRKAMDHQASGGSNIALVTLTRVGEIAASSVRAKIVDGPFLPLAPMTLANRAAKGRKGTKPLIDTGAMRQSVTFVLEDI